MLGVSRKKNTKRNKLSPPQAESTSAATAKVATQSDDQPEQQSSNLDRQQRAATWKRGKESWKESWRKTKDKNEDERWWAYCVPDPETGEPVIKCEACCRQGLTNKLATCGSKTIRLQTLKEHESNDEHFSALQSGWDLDAQRKAMQAALEKLT